MKTASPLHRLASVATSLLALLCVTAGAVVRADGLDPYLVARWTFNDGTLKADQGGYILERKDWGSSPALDLANGQARIGSGTFLTCKKINSADQPDLARTVTLWVRLRIESPLANDAFLFGLRDQVDPGEWRNIVLCALGQPTQPGHTSFYSRLSNKEICSRSSNLPELLPGDFRTLALVFDGNARTVTWYVDGQQLEGRHRDATALDAFNNFAIGRLKASASAPPMSVDEIRIYGIALTSEWIAEIDPVSSPTK
ncbi:hypothetical protein OPIT5_25575 [Opitutaceae bacterium TAV5]|nr:hypothetical protein OPIT5_25575 [Opitutaceae bacterium TAV5]